MRLSESQEFCLHYRLLTSPMSWFRRVLISPVLSPHQPTAKHLPPCSVPLHFTPLQRDKRVCRCRNQLLYMACSHLGCKNCPSCAPQPEDSSGGERLLSLWLNFGSRLSWMLHPGQSEEPVQTWWYFHREAVTGRKRQWVTAKERGLMGWKERLDKVQVNKQQCGLYWNLLFRLETCHKVRKWSQERKVQVY